VSCHETVVWSVARVRVFVIGHPCGDVKINVIATTGLEDEPTTTFATDTPKIYAIFKTKGISAGDEVQGALIAEDVGHAAAANTKVLEQKLSLNEDTDGGDSNFSKPTNGWPAGKYRLELYVNGEVVAKAKFTVGSPEKVLFNLTGGAGTTVFQTSGGDKSFGTHPAVDGGKFTFSNLVLTGRLINIGGDVQFVSGAMIPAVPEPGTFGLIAIGTIALLCAVKRSRV
jgi:PEP-CTERM motif